MDTVRQALDAYDEALNEVHGPVMVAGYEFGTSRTLKELDPIAYRVGFHDWLDSEGIDSDDLTGWDEVEL